MPGTVIARMAHRIQRVIGALTDGFPAAAPS